MTVVLLAIGVVPVGAGGKAVKVTHDCVSVRSEPHKIMFACADGGYYVDHLDWKSWGQHRARARGIFHKNDCDPSCAGGSFHKVPGTIRLSRPGLCPKIDKTVFKHAEITYDRPDFNGDEGESLKLYCPL